MLTFILSFMLGVLPTQSDKATPPFLVYLDQQYVAYNFDDKGYEHCCQVSGQMTPQERKKTIFYCYFQVQKSKFSDSYMDLLDRIDEVAKYLAKTAPRYEDSLKSWDEFKLEYRKQGVKTLPFIGYGSMVNQNELRRILPTEREVVPVIGFGARGVFKLHSPTYLTRQLPSPGHEQEKAVLALEEQEGKEVFDLQHLFNGVMFDLQENEIEVLQKWEPNYQIKRVPVIKMKRLNKTPIRVDYAYTLVNNSPADKSFKPHLNYLNLVIDTFDDGDPEVQDFVRLFTEVSFLADGTSVEQWLEAEVKAYYQDDLIVQPIVRQHLKAIDGLS